MSPKEKKKEERTPSPSKASGSDKRLAATPAESSFSLSQEILDFFASKSAILNQEEKSSGLQQGTVTLAAGDLFVVRLARASQDV